MVDVEQMVRRQRILADFGDFALRSENIDDVLTEACRLVGRALGTDLAKVLEIVGQGENAILFMQAGVGWPDDTVGTARVPMNELSSETYAITSGAPVLVSDILQEKRFTFPAFMKKAGVRGMVNVPILLPGGKPYGLLQVDSRKVWAPRNEDIEFLRTYATILGPVIDRLHKIHDLRQAADRNQTLLRELQHRIKNNIAVIASLVRMRMKKTSSVEIRDELSVIGERINALRLVHDHVYTARNADRLSLRPYVTQLLEGLLMLRQDMPIQLALQVEDLDVKSDIAIPLGLILNEFATNSMKYAFTGKSEADTDVIAVDARRHDEWLYIRIWDNGKGLPVEGSGSGSCPRPGTGMALIEGLARQIGAIPEWSCTHGTALHLEIPYRS